MRQSTALERMDSSVLLGQPDENNKKEKCFYIMGFIILACTYGLSFGIGYSVHHCESLQGNVTM